VLQFVKGKLSETTIFSPTAFISGSISHESHSIFLLDMHLGIGGDGIELMMRSETATDDTVVHTDGSEGEMFETPSDFAAKILITILNAYKKAYCLRNGRRKKRLYIETLHGLVNHG
jgi:hypothetical protein